MIDAELPKVGEIKTAWELIGWDDGLIRIVGGRTNYEAVMYNAANDGRLVKLAKLVPGRRFVFEVKRYVDPETRIQIVSRGDDYFDSTNREFLDRPETTRRIGLMDAASIPVWRRRKWPLPTGLRVACKSLNTGRVYEALDGERLHCQIAMRLGTAISDERLIDGFTVSKQNGLHRADNNAK